MSIKKKEQKTSPYRICSSNKNLEESSNLMHQIEPRLLVQSWLLRFWSNFLFMYLKSNRRLHEYLGSCQPAGEPGVSSWLLNLTWPRPGYHSYSWSESAKGKLGDFSSLTPSPPYVHHSACKANKDLKQ